MAFNIGHHVTTLVSERWVLAAAPMARMRRLRRYLPRGSYMLMRLDNFGCRAIFATLHVDARVRRSGHELQSAW